MNIEETAAGYNGWTNRNTWLVNLHFGEGIRSSLEDGEEINASMIEDIFYNYMEAETDHLNVVVKDFMDWSEINWEELAEYYMAWSWDAPVRWPQL